MTQDQSPTGITASNFNNMFNIQIPTATKVAWAESGAGGVFTHSAESHSAMTTGVWYHICGVFASTTSRLVYRNGVAGTVNTTSSSPASLITSWIGIVAGQNAVRGAIAFVGIWSIDLSAAEVAALANACHPRRIRPANLVACVNLTGTNSTEPDMVSSTGWTVSGSISEVANPRIYM